MSQDALHREYIIEALGGNHRCAFHVDAMDGDAVDAAHISPGSIVVEAKGSHAVYVSQPRAVADLIAKAANGVALATR